MKEILTDALPDILRPKDIAEFLGISKDSAIRLLESDQMPVICIRKSKKTRYMVWKTVFIRWLEGGYKKNSVVQELKVWKSSVK